MRQRTETCTTKCSIKSRAHTQTQRKTVWRLWIFKWSSIDDSRIERKRLCSLMGFCARIKFNSSHCAANVCAHVRLARSPKHRHWFLFMIWFNNVKQKRTISKTENRDLERWTSASVESWLSLLSNRYPSPVSICTIGIMFATHKYCQPSTCSQFGLFRHQREADVYRPPSVAEIDFEKANELKTIDRSILLWNRRGKHVKSPLLSKQYFTSATRAITKQQQPASTCPQLSNV